MAAVPWQMQLFQHSLMKKEKVCIIRKRVAFSGRKILDLGCSQGTVSFMLRQGGGQWIHADSDSLNTVASRELLGGSVIRVTGGRLPFSAACFDAVVLLDFLEHVDDDAGVLTECRRVLRAKGQLVISTPISGGFFLLNKLKKVLGLTPDKYGHKREGYSLQQLAAMLERAGFATIYATTYAKFFSEFFEILLNTLYVRRNRQRPDICRSGTISPASAVDLKIGSPWYWFYAHVIYPLLWLLSKLDLLLAWKTGYATLVIAEKT